MNQETRQMGGFEQGILNLGATLSDPFRNSVMGSPNISLLRAAMRPALSCWPLHPAWVRRSRAPREHPLPTAVSAPTRAVSRPGRGGGFD